MKHRIFCIFMSLLLLLGVPSGYIASTHDSNNMKSSTVFEPTDIPVKYKPSEYINGEVLVCYTDGTIEVISFDSDDFLLAGLTLLEQDETVQFLQPNYSYQADALSTGDPLFNQQWALFNDGTFEREDELTQAPIYDTPFDIPSDFWYWDLPDYFDYFDYLHSFFGLEYPRTASAEQTVIATAGIDIKAQAAWELYNGGTRDVVVALIDTGIDFSHEDLTDAFWVNEDEIDGNGIDDDNNGYVDDIHGWNFYHNSNRIYTNNSDDSHGTHGAGTIAATSGNSFGITGIVNSDSVKIMSLKALGGRTGTGDTADIVKAIHYAEANGASICNLSLGSSINDRALYQAIANSSMLFVVAAGNDAANTDRAPYYPASYDLDNIISVANLSYDGSLHSSSNYGAKSVDLAAPGTYILSTTPKNGYDYMTGTSMAAPFVSAAAAMLYSHYDSITLADVKTILLSTVTELETLQGKTVSNGMLNLGEAMAYDISQLKSEPEEVSDTPENSNLGNAPEISIETLTYQRNTYLIVTIKDTDDDLTHVLYSTGELTAEQFQNGTVGIAFTLDYDDSSTFLVRNSGSYTFYARDNAGNEVVQTINITVDTQQPPMISLPDSGRNRNGGYPGNIPFFDWWY